MFKSLLLATLLTHSAMAQEIPTVKPTVSTEGSIFTGDKRDDPAIWVHPTDPSLSLVIGTDKRTDGGLHIYNLRAKELEYLQGGRLNNVDIITDFFSDGDLMYASERNEDTISFFKINRQANVSRLKTDLKVTGEPYGICGGTSKGKHYVFVTTKQGPVEQWEIAPPVGDRIIAQLVRTLQPGSMCEGCVVDKKGENYYLANEDHMIMVYNVNPSTANKFSALDQVGKHLTADIEGLTIYDNGKHEYLIASSQGDSTFAVYQPKAPKGQRYIGSFKIAGTNETDGIDCTAKPLGRDFPKGLFVVHNHKLSNFRFVSWEEIAKALNLPD